MSVFRYDNYRGEIAYNESRLTFGPAGPGDCAELAGMYADISINEGNYRTRLDPASPESFARVGGMFVIHTEDSIKMEIESGESFFAVAKDENGRIAASFWVSKSDPNFLHFDSYRYEGARERGDALTAALSGGTVVYPRELITTPGCRYPKIAHLMFYTIFRVMRANGYTHSLGEVYGVHGFSDGGTPVVIDMLNERSFRMVQSTGGVCLGSFPYRDLQIGPLTVTIESRIFHFDYEVMLPGLERAFKKCNITVEFEETGI